MNTNPKAKNIDIPHNQMTQIRTLNFHSNTNSIKSTPTVDLDHVKTQMNMKAPNQKISTQAYTYVCRYGIIMFSIIHSSGIMSHLTKWCCSYRFVRDVAKEKFHRRTKFLLNNFHSDIPGKRRYLIVQLRQCLQSQLTTKKGKINSQPKREK